MMMFQTTKFSHSDFPVQNITASTSDGKRCAKSEAIEGPTDSLASLLSDPLLFLFPGFLPSTCVFYVSFLPPCVSGEGEIERKRETDRQTTRHKYSNRH